MKKDQVDDKNTREYCEVRFARAEDKKEATDGLIFDEARYEPMLEADTPNARYRAAKYPRRVGYALGLWGGLEALDELNSEVSDVREGVRHGALLGALASRTH